MRWRTEKEVLAGKGENVCGNKVLSYNKIVRIARIINI